MYSTMLVHPSVSASSIEPHPNPLTKSHHKLYRSSVGLNDNPGVKVYYTIQYIIMLVESESSFPHVEMHSSPEF